MSNEMIVKHIPSPTDREKIYSELYDKLNYSFTYLDKTKSYYQRTLYRCNMCKKDWMLDECDNNSCCDICSYCFYDCQKCNNNIGDNISMDISHNYLINNMLVYSNNKYLLIDYKNKNTLTQAKKIRKIYNPVKQKTLFDYYKNRDVTNDKFIQPYQLQF